MQNKAGEGQISYNALNVDKYILSTEKNWYCDAILVMCCSASLVVDAATWK